MRLFRKRTPEESFWGWFTKNQASIAAIRTGTEAIIPELARRLIKVREGLAWEKGDLPDGTRDFVISADGIVDHWASVRRLVDAAPPLPGWRITAFRPRKEMEKVEFQGERLSLDGLAFTYDSTPTKGPLDLTLFIEGLAGGNRDALLGATFILLDSLLGEEKVMTTLGELTFLPLAEGVGDELPIRDLVALVDSR